MAQASNAIVSTTVIAGVEQSAAFRDSAGCGPAPSVPGRRSRRTGRARSASPQNARTSGMLLMTSTISPSTAAALSAKSSCKRLAGGRQMEHRHHHRAGDHDQPAAIGRLTVPIRAIAATVAMQGGSTFQTNMFSTVKTAFDVAVMRLVSMPGSRSEK